MIKNSLGTVGAYSTMTNKCSRREGGQELKAGTGSRNRSRDHRGVSITSSFPMALIQHNMVVSYSTQDQLSRCDTIHDGLGSTTSIAS